MTQFDKRILNQKSKELSFNRDTLEKVFRLEKILEYVNSDSQLSKSLALKGGTAINLTILKLPRLSVDIDFDYTVNCSREDMLKNRVKINEKLNSFMKMEGYTNSKKSKSFYSLDSLVFNYSNSATMVDNIKIEINYSLRCHIFPSQKQKININKLFNSMEVNILNPIEIFASKSLALSTRVAARDLYDMNSILNEGLIEDINLLRNCFVFYVAICSNDDINDFDITDLDRLTFYKIKTTLYPVIKRDEKFDLELSKEKVKNYLAQLYKFTENQKLFLSDFREKRYNPKLLFDGEMLERVLNHPMALWKMK